MALRENGFSYFGRLDEPMRAATCGSERRFIVKFSAALAIGLCLIASTGHAQGWMTGLGAFLQGDQEHYLQQQNIQRGYPAQVYRPSYGGQSQPNYFILNGRVITCIPMGNGSTYCQ